MDADHSPGAGHFVEPTEGAFTLLVPPGWHCHGGVVRVGGNARPWYRVTSPGGGAELRGGDPRVPLSYLDPGMMMAMPLPGMALRGYVPARYFAEEYAHFFARERGAGAPAVTGLRDVEAMLRGDPRPDARPKIAMLLQGGADIAGVDFSCAGGATRGVVDVVTIRVAGMSGTIWSPFVTAMVAPADAWDAASETLTRVARSYATGAQWQSRQTQIQNAHHASVMDTIATGTAVQNILARSGMEAIDAHAARARMSAEASAAASASQDAAFASRMASMDESQRRAVNAVREEVDLYDPTTGRVYRGAPAGVAHWWSDGATRVVGSDSPENPDAARYHRVVDLDDVKRRG